MVNSFFHRDLGRVKAWETKRIKNPDDESQFVDVENIKKLVTEQGEGAKYQKSTYTFANK